MFKLTRKPEPISTDKIWYAAYGSNLFPHRLNWYLHGGKAPTSSHWYTPSSDRTPIQARFSGQLPYKLYFAKESLIWGGSKAFIDVELEPDRNRHAQAAFYLLNREQFEHIVWQENWQSEMPSPNKLGIETLLDAYQKKSGPRTISTGYPSDYSGLIFCGTARSPDGFERDVRYPVLSFTLENGFQPHELDVPSKPYLQHIAEGLRQSFPLWEDKEVAEYLSSTPGAGDLEPGAVLEAVAEHLHIEDPRMAKHPPPPLLAYQGGRGAAVKVWQRW